MRVDEELIFEKTDYYGVFCLLSEVSAEGKWLARVRVKRNDTEEYINSGFTAYDHEKDVVIGAAKKRTKIELMPELNKMGKPPDWDSETRKILLLCKKNHSGVFDFAQWYSDGALVEENERARSCVNFCKSLIKDSISISKKIDCLSNFERIEMLTISDAAFNAPSDPWCLEEIDLSILVFDFYSHPTIEETELSEPSLHLSLTVGWFTYGVMLTFVSTNARLLPVQADLPPIGFRKDVLSVPLYPF